MTGRMTQQLATERAWQWATRAQEEMSAGEHANAAECRDMARTWTAVAGQLQFIEPTPDHDEHLRILPVMRRTDGPAPSPETEQLTQTTGLPRVVEPGQGGAPLCFCRESRYGHMPTADCIP